MSLIIIDHDTIANMYDERYRSVALRIFSSHIRELIYDVDFCLKRLGTDIFADRAILVSRSKMNLSQLDRKLSILLSDTNILTLYRLRLFGLNDRFDNLSVIPDLMNKIVSTSYTGDTLSSLIDALNSLSPEDNHSFFLSLIDFTIYLSVFINLHYSLLTQYPTKGVLRG